MGYVNSRAKPREGQIVFLWSDVTLKPESEWRPMTVIAEDDTVVKLAWFGDGGVMHDAVLPLQALWLSRR